eukprot:1149637-Pelagomonas_calceolata.AAC.1
MKKERKKGHAYQAGPHHTDQEEEQAHKSTPASRPPPWDLRHNYQAGPVQQAQDPPLSPKHALQHLSMGLPLPYESQPRLGGEHGVHTVYSSALFIIRYPERLSVPTSSRFETFEHNLLEVVPRAVPSNTDCNKRFVYVTLAGMYASQIWATPYLHKVMRWTTDAKMAIAIFQQIRSANPLDLSQLVVDLRSRHLAYWRQSSACHRNLNSKNVHVITGALSQPGMLTLCIPTMFYPSICTGICPNTSCAVWPDLATWNDGTSPTCDLQVTTSHNKVSDAQDDAQDEQHALFKCTHSHVRILWLRHASLFSGPLLSPSSAYSQTVPYLSSIHHVQSFDTLERKKDYACQVWPHALRK